MFIMEIDAVANCNQSIPVYTGRKPKTRLFPDLPVIKEQRIESNQAPSFYQRTDPITTALLGFSDAADLEIRKQKFRKRSFNKDQFGPWHSKGKCQPLRKKPWQNRSGKRSTNSNLSTPGRYSSPDRRASQQLCKHSLLHHSNGEFNNEDNLQHLKDTDVNAHEQEWIEKNDIDNCNDTCLSPTLTDTRRYDLTKGKADKLFVSKGNSPDIESTKDKSLPSDTHLDLQPKHSLPTVITLKSADDGSNKYDSVFSLGKYDLTSKDIIISMGQSRNRYPSRYQRQRKSALDKENSEPLQNGIGEDFLGEKDGHSTSSDFDVGHSKSNKHNSQLKGTKSTPAPMCEYLDISLHMRYYRMHHTVRQTGLASLANYEDEEKEESKPVLWDDVFPDRPLSTTTRSATTVPVFRFSVSDFRREHVTAVTSDNDNIKNGDFETVDTFIKEATTKSMVKSVKADLYRNADRSATGKSRSRLLKATVASTLENPKLLTKHDSKARQFTISLTPTVRPVLQGSQSPLTLEPNDTSEFEHKQNGKKKIKKEKCTTKKDTLITNHGKTDLCLCVENGNDKYQTKGSCENDDEDIAADSKSHNTTKKDEHEIEQEKNNSVSRLSKTREYIKSSYSVYNDTIQNVAGPSSEFSNTVDYREYLKRKRRYVGKTSFSLDVENMTEIIQRQHSFPFDIDDQWMKSKHCTTPHRLEGILRNSTSIKDYSSDLEYKTIHHKALTLSKAQDFGVLHQNVEIWPADLHTSSRSKSVERGRRPTLTIDAEQLRESVERKIHEGNRLLSRHFVNRSVESNDRFIRFLVKDERNRHLTNRPAIKGKFQRMGKVHYFSTDNDIDKLFEKNPSLASMYDLSVAGDPIVTKDSSDSTKSDINDSPRHTTGFSQTSHEQPTPTHSAVNAKKIWKPSASHLKANQPERPESRPVSSAFHYRPSPSSASAFVIANPPQQLGFDDRSVVLPLDDFVQMAMKSREGSFSALSNSVNSGSKVGIAPNTTGKTNHSKRKSPDDGVVRVVSFATPVNQFIFAKRVTGYPLTSNISSPQNSKLAEDEGRYVLQRKTAGSYRLNLNDAARYKHQDNDKRKKDVKGDPRDKEGEKIKDDYTSADHDRTFKDTCNDTLDSKQTEQVNDESRSKTESLIQESFNHDKDAMESNMDNNSKTKGSIFKEKDLATGNKMVHFALRNKVVHLVEMNGDENASIDYFNNSSLKKIQSSPNLFMDCNNKSDIDIDCKISYEEDAIHTDPSPFTLQDKLFQLKQKRKKALQRNPLWKPSSIVRKSLPHAPAYTTMTSKYEQLDLGLDEPKLGPRMTLTHRDGGPRDSNQPMRISEDSVTPRSPRCPKSVRFAELDDNDDNV